VPELLLHHVVVILVACLADALVGDPVYRLHPIRVLGAAIRGLERVLFALGLRGYVGGALHWLLMITLALGGWWAVHAGLALWSPWAALVWDAALAYSLLCLRDLVQHGRRVLTDLDDLAAARDRVAMLVGRETAQLDRGGVVRATIESLSENLTDGVLTPLWALCLFGVPGLIVVKVVSSLDSMLGYRNERYRRFGWWGARSDDLVHFVPARCSALLIAAAAAVLRLHPVSAVKTAWRDHGMLASPNSGWSEAACAGALQVRLMGPIVKAGQQVHSAFMGDASWPSDLGAQHLRQALRLTVVCGVLAVVIGLALTPLRLYLPW
jgi:adenosylcobinamide-phosphate synthase